MKKRSYRLASSSLLVFLFFFSLSLKGQQERLKHTKIEDFTQLIASSEELFIKIVNRSYTDEQLTATDTIYFLKEGKRSYYKTTELEYLVFTGEEEQLLLIDHENEMMALRVPQEQELDPLAFARDTTRTFVFNETCQCLRQDDALGDKDIYIEAYFHPDHRLKKTIYQTKVGGKRYRSEATYEAFCLDKGDKNCFTFSLPSLSEYLQKQNGEWSVNPRYRNYLLNIY